MATVGIRELKQNASAVVARVEAGETVTVTDRGRPAAQLTPLPSSPLSRLLAAGAARAARTRLDDLPEPLPAPSGAQTLSDALAELRDER